MQAYDPLDYDNLAKSVVDALLTAAEKSLPPENTFEGAGVYAIYYHGDFGNHDPGAGRQSMKRPRWDILHPGRPWAEKLAPEETFEQVLQRLREFLG